MLYSQRRFDDDVRLCKRATFGALIGLLALLAWALTYASLHGTGDRPMVGYLSGWLLVMGAPFIGGGVLCGFAVHLLRERRR
ncbi:hypothetical protein P12x_005856 [Tundrisphaera lichenicola]|uniref:hypothetical protein n=1 Tax=Tundrisphaera lichenicola TaxID=2029860 RepID=UPI003EBA8497